MVRCRFVQDKELRLRLALLSVIGISSCVGTPNIASGETQAAECMAGILKAVPGAQNVTTGFTYETRESRYVPTVKYSFADSSTRHAVEIAIGGNEAVGYGYFQRDIPPSDGNPVTADVQNKWFAQCRADALAVTM